MDSATQQKILEHHGWDNCDHERTRRFCPECKWDVPAYMRRQSPKHSEIAPPLDHPEPDYETINAEAQEAAEEEAEEEN